MRWVDSSYTEDFIGLIQVDTTDAATLAYTIKGTLLRMNLQLTQCRGQAYDAAANMAGRLNGVAMRLQSEQNSILFVHCMAHCLNLCLQDCAHNCSCVRTALGVTSDLANFIRASPKRLALFNKLKNEISFDTPGLKPLCPTRWTVHTGALEAVIKNYAVIIAELEIIAMESYGEPSRKATGLLALMEKFTTFFGLKLSFLVFSATEQLSRTLQRSDITAQESSLAANAATTYLRRQPVQSSFEHFYLATIEEAKGVTEPPTLPRQRKMPARFENDDPNNQFCTPEEYFQNQYAQIFDSVANELDRRFNQKSFEVLREIENIVIDSSNSKPVEPSANFQTIYSSDLHLQDLKIQLLMLPDFLNMSSRRIIWV